MRHCSLHRCFPSSSFEQDDRLAGGSLSQRPGKPARLLHALDIYGDHLSAVVLCEMLQEIRLVEVGGIAEADGLSHEHPALRSGEDEVLGIASALAEIADLAAVSGDHPVEREAGFGTVQAQAVRSYQANAPAPGEINQLLLSKSALLGPR